ncbi:MAG: hypothetical protein U9Q06_02630 [Nanoarchaeota archaeon]|nr:hypothetical protein [Nanoarchaeota archaeon]
MAEKHEVNNLEELLGLEKGSLFVMRQTPVERGHVDFYWDKDTVYGGMVSDPLRQPQCICVEFLSFQQDSERGHRRIDSEIYDVEKLRFEKGLVVTSTTTSREGGTSYLEGTPGYDERISLFED